MADFSKNNSNFVRIVYTKVKTNGQTELVPLKLYTDAAVEDMHSLPLGMITDAAIPLGTLISNRYLITQVLGQGGFGRTYLAADQHCFNKACVLKEFFPTVVGDYHVEKSRDLFEREARILYQVDHPQIPKFMACFEDNGRLFLVQEFVKGKTYSTLLKERLSQQGKAFLQAEVTQWLKDLLPVLNYIHRQNIIHRDISPDNVMLLQDKNLPVLIDFGVGKQMMEQLHTMKLNDLSSSSTASPGGNVSFVGKVGYAPREQIYMGHCSPSSDLYALGVTAIVLLTGKAPEALMDRYSLEWQWRNYTCVSPDLAQVLDKLLADKPKDRYQSTQEVLTDLYQLTAPGVTSVSHIPQNSVSNQPTTVVSQVPQNRSHQPSTVVSQAPVSQSSHQPSHISYHAAQERSFINPSFIELCQQELTNYIGPIAVFLVKEVLQQNPQSPQTLVEALVAKIPNPQQAIEFRRRLL